MSCTLIVGNDITYVQDNNLITPRGYVIRSKIHPLSQNHYEKFLNGEVPHGPNRECEFYPCHWDGQYCDFCYCPFYPCGDSATGGEWIKGKGVWNCTNCHWLHEKETVEYLREPLENILEEVEDLKTKKKTGIQALNFREGDSLAEVTLIKDEEMFIVTRKGFVVRMKSTDISASGRLTVGVKGINLTEGDEVVAVLPIRDATDDLAVFSEYGIGKRIPIKEFTLQGRGTRGLMCYKMTEATGNIAAATLVSDDDMVLVAGVPNSICIKGSDIAIGSRSALGVQIIKGSKILSVSKV
jgi:Zn-finger protein